MVGVRAPRSGQTPVGGLLAYRVAKRLRWLRISCLKLNFDGRVRRGEISQIVGPGTAIHTDYIELRAGGNGNTAFSVPDKDADYAGIRIRISAAVPVNNVLHQCVHGRDRGVGVESYLHRASVLSHPRIDGLSRNRWTLDRSHKHTIQVEVIAFVAKRRIVVALRSRRVVRGKIEKQVVLDLPLFREENLHPSVVITRVVRVGNGGGLGRIWIEKQENHVAFGVADECRRGYHRAFAVVTSAVVVCVIAEVAGLLSNVVPGRSPVVERKGHAVQDRSFQAYYVGGDLETNPQTGRRKNTHIITTRGSIDTPANAVRSPICSMLPIPRRGVPLQHDLRGRIDRIKVNIRHHDVAGVHRKCRCGVVEVMLVSTGRDD